MKKVDGDCAEDGCVRRIISNTNKGKRKTLPMLARWSWKKSKQESTMNICLVLVFRRKLDFSGSAKG